MMTGAIVSFLGIFTCNHAGGRRRMKSAMKPSGMKNALLIVSLFACSGCVGPKIAADLLSNTRRSEKPRTQSSSVVNVALNPRINNFERLDQTVKQSLEMALGNANLFGSDSARPYRIDAKILMASQAPMSFGSFGGQLELQYVVHDPDGREILDKVIHTEAGSDKWYFNAAARHRRSRAVNISKNVLQFVDVLQTVLQK